MEIYVVESVSKERSKNALPEIFERIFSICKTDKNFASKDKMQNIEEQTKDLNIKIKKQEALISKSENIKAEILSKIETLDENNLTIRSQLLESLGSEL